jgi:hypothetical protein
MNTGQKIELLTDLFVKQNFRNGERGYFYIEGPSLVMGRIMLYSNYQPFVGLYNQNSSISNFVTYAWGISDINKELIISNAQTYLNHIKTK